jgi:hypothetical protein
MICQERLLVAAKEELPHGEWMKLIESELPFKKSTSAALMRIASDERLVNLQHVGILPPHWGTLAELTRLPDDVSATWAAPPRHCCFSS